MSSWVNVAWLEKEGETREVGSTPINTRSKRLLAGTNYRPPGIRVCGIALDNSRQCLGFCLV